MSGSKRRILPPYRENVNEFLKDTNLLAIAKDLFSVGLVDGKVYKIAGLDYKTILAKKEEIVGGVLASVDDLGKLRQFVEVLERHRSSEHDVEFIEKMKRKYNEASDQQSPGMTTGCSDDVSSCELKTDPLKMSPTSKRIKKANEQDLKLHLSKTGLHETTFWFSHLAELGVESLSSLRHIQGDIESFDELSKKARNKVEKRALLELLTISGPSDTAQENRKKMFLIIISEWNKNMTSGPDEIERQIQYVLAEKQRVQLLNSDEKWWAQEYLSNELINKFLEKIIQQEFNSTNIKKIILEIIDQNDWNYINEEILPQIKNTSSWINEIYEPFDMKRSITDLDMFDFFLLKTLKREKLLKHAKSDNDLAKYIAEGLYYLRHNYKQKYEDALILILTHPFTKNDTNDVVSLRPLSLSELEFIQKSFVEKRKDFKKCSDKSHLILQAYILLLAVSACANNNERAIMIFMKQIYYRMEEMQLPLENEISFFMKLFFDGLPLASLKQNLSHLLVPPCQGRILKLTKQKQIPRETPPVLEQGLELINGETVVTRYVEDEFSVLHNNPVVHAFLEKLNLCFYYPKKLRLIDALCITEEALELSLKETSITDPKQLPFLIIQKLLAYDGLCRSNLMPLAQALHCISDISGDDNRDDEQSLKEQDIVATSIHPIDCLLAIILCSDDFLTADLLSRLAKCQYALPFLIPNPFKDEFFVPLWAMSYIIKEWKSTNDSEQPVSHYSPITKYPMPIITFIRIGSNDQNNYSKSKILNELISDSHHDYFFHRDCHGGQFNTLLGKGLVDMCWYLPSGNKADYSFPDAVTFLNLHGDAREFKVQCQFLSQVSFMCIAFLTECNPSVEDEMEVCFQEFNSLPGGMFFLNCFEKPPKSLKNIFPKLELYNLVFNKKSKTATEIKYAIHSQINVKLAGVKEFQCIEDLSRQAKRTIIVMDEDNECYRRSLDHANIIKGLVRSLNKTESSIKEVMLPLQGDKLWKAWASCEKEVYRQMKKGAESINEYSAKMEKEKNIIRNDQLKFVINLTPVMKAFIGSVLELGVDKNRSLRNFYLQILKFELNSISRENISQKQHHYKGIRKEVSQLQTESSSQTPEVKTQISKLTKDMDTLQEEIINSSMGLEHLLRELSQVYEAALDAKNGEIHLDSQDVLNKYITCLPKIAAELLIEGYPLELMDGDAAHVPLQWVVAVIKEAAVLLDDPKVFVLSVLGLQSTGKSTMLNTTFGLQFNVSTGRCTRGAFMQLLPLDDKLKEKTKCSYVIIVDTEGLRAPELDPAKTQKHDNELATFVIGLANMTLINIYGEVPGDIDDILQTSVHALLRMTKIKRNSSCQFIHQNAGVNVKGEVSRAKFTQKLNQFTIDAAAEEHCEGQYEAFKDVIQFDDQKDIHYFPGLWKGDPPMAPVNPGYSHTAQFLKHQFIQDLCKRTSLKATSLEDARSGDLNLSSYPITISDFWEALMKEKFVFSFKNTHEIKAYNSLEAAYYNWSWVFKSKMLEWEQKTENVIITESHDTLTNKVEEKLSKLRQYVSTTLYEPIKEEMEAFFNGKQSEILIQWKAYFEIRLETLSTKLLAHAEDHCNNLLKNRLTIHGFETARQKSVDFIKKKVFEHIENVQSEQETLQKSLEKKELNSDQLKSLLSRDLFNPQQLTQLQKDDILTSDEVDMIKSHIAGEGGQLDEKTIKTIFEQKLTLPQATKILKKPHMTEDELHAKFEKTWVELIKQLPTRTPSLFSIRHEVEQALTSFIQSQKGYHGQLNAKLTEKSLDKWDSDLRFVPKNPKHYDIKSTMNKFSIVRLIRGTTDEYDLEAQEVTASIFNAAHFHLNYIKSKITAFNSAFVDDLLKHVKETMETCFNHKDRKIVFTNDYKLDIYITVCSYSVGVFEKMARQFDERNDPKLYLEKNEKIPLYTKFKNQYKQTEAEVAIADTLCAYLEEPIKYQIRKSMGKMIVDKMKTSEYYHFANKMALKLKILKDLKEEDNFTSYMFYIEDIKGCLKSKLKSYTITYCNEKLPNSNITNLQVVTSDEVSRLVDIVDSVLSSINSTDIKEWLATFCRNDNLREELAVDLKVDNLLGNNDVLEELNLKNFKDQIREELYKLKTKCTDIFSNIDYEREMAKWKDKPHELLSDLIGCTEQCPFCKEQCDLLENHNCDHRTEVHRVSCLAGWRDTDTQEMATDICPVLIDSGNQRFRRPDGEYQYYKEYKKVYENWSIPPNKSPKTCSYWMWFVGNYKDQLAKRFQANTSKIPSDWSTITWPSIKESLKTAYNIEA